ncbi:Serine/threonine-protein phosphatase 7 long form homolog, partial [Linum perenne]
YCAYSSQGEHRLLHCRRARTIPPYNELYTPYLRTVGLFGVHELVRMRLDHDLITALIERWRPETHTFHMPEGECTVTLQDVNIISGLPVNGRAVTGRTSGQWIQMIDDFLGHTLDVGSTEIKGSQLKLQWLNENFRALPPNPTPLHVERYARAYMLCLIGGFLFPNKSTQYVHLMMEENKELVKEMENGKNRLKDVIEEQRMVIKEKEVEIEGLMKLKKKVLNDDDGGDEGLKAAMESALSDLNRAVRACKLVFFVSLLMVALLILSLTVCGSIVKIVVKRS